MQAKHAVAEPWRSHLKSVQEAIRQDADNILKLRGQIALIEAEQKSKIAHATNIVNQLSIEADLPKSSTGYSLSEDSCFLVGEVEVTTEPAPIKEPI
jgi:hypothetical protein